LLPVHYSNRKFTIVVKTKTIKNKLITITMNKFKFFMLHCWPLLLQVKHKNINQAKKAIDAE
jgi:hypothetical protein